MKIKVLLVMPEREAQTVKIPRSKKFIKMLIGKELLKVRLSKNIILIANKNPDIAEFNRILGGNIILGTFIIVVIKNKHMVSMTKREIRKYMNMFKLGKHKSKIDMYKDECLEEYYSNQRVMRQKNAENNKREIFNKVA